MENGFCESLFFLINAECEINLDLVLYLGYYVFLYCADFLGFMILYNNCLRLPSMFPVLSNVEASIKIRGSIPEEKIEGYIPAPDKVAQDLIKINRSQIVVKTAIKRFEELVKQFNDLFLESKCASINYESGSDLVLSLPLEIENLFSGQIDNNWAREVQQNFTASYSPQSENCKYYAFLCPLMPEKKEVFYNGLTIRKGSYYRSYEFLVESKIGIAHTSWQLPHF